MFIDTHVHFNMMVKKEFNTPLPKDAFDKIQIIITQAQQNNVEKFICAGTSAIESQNCIEIAQHFPQVFSAVGLHPTDCTENWKDELDQIKRMLDNKEQNKIVAIGECGLDKHWYPEKIDLQMDVFKAHAELAQQYNLPLLIHCRKARDEMFKCIEEFGSEITGILHSFFYDLEYAHLAIQNGFLLGVGGPISYPKNDDLRTTIKQIDLKNLVLESDSPYLPPQIIRGQQNQPKYIKYIAEYLANLKESSLEEVDAKTTSAACALLNL